MKKRIGVFGFAANPPHINHWIIAEQARAQFNLEWVYIIVAGGAVDKPELADPELRWEMTVADCADDPNMRPLRLEIDREGPSYTYITLEQLKEMHKGEDAEFFFIIGRDRAGNFAGWKNVEQIIANCTLLVAPRNCAHKSVSKKWLERALPKGTKYGCITVDYSSTWLRGRVAVGGSVRYMMREGARRVLEAKGRDAYVEKPRSPATGEVCCSGSRNTKRARRSARR